MSDRSVREFTDGQRHIASGITKAYAAIDLKPSSITWSCGDNPKQLPFTKVDVEIKADGAPVNTISFTREQVADCNSGLDRMEVQLVLDSLEQRLQSMTG